ncbi:MAG: alpha-E domain-containing protein [Pseudomonadota bacterium]
MLSRTAENLYWLARYIERAENIARLLDVTLRMASLPQEKDTGDSEWRSAIIASGCEESFFATRERATPETVLYYLTCDRDNPSSIISCMSTARNNARMVRTALSISMWEAINSTWIEMNTLCQADFTPERVGRFLDWVKERSLLFGGTVASTLLRSDAFWFCRLGMSIERADNTSRILDVKYNILLPAYETVGGTMDYYQWASVLRSVSALRAYHWVYRDRVKPWLVAELLILKPEMPRSLAYCISDVSRQLESLAGAYGTRGECHRLAGQMDARLRYSTIEQIFALGLHEFLTGIVEDTRMLGDEITRQYLT